MSIDLLSRKQSILFSIIDFDQDGIATEADVKQVGVRLSQLYRHTEFSLETQDVTSAFDAFWNSVQPALNTVTFDKSEWTNAIIQVGDSHDFRASLIALGESIFDLYDADYSGAISWKEFSEAQIAMGLNEKDIRVAFDRLDTDGDGKISRQEMVSAIIEFHTSVEEGAVGNWLYGQP